MFPALSLSNENAGPRQVLTVLSSAWCYLLVQCEGPRLAGLGTQPYLFESRLCNLLSPLSFEEICMAFMSLFLSL